MRLEQEGYEFGEVTVKAKTEKAVLVVDEEGNTLNQGEERWIPLSQIHDDSEIFETSDVGDCGMLVVSAWLARQEGW